MFCEAGEAPMPLSVVFLLVASVPLGCFCIWPTRTVARIPEKGKGKGKERKRTWVRTFGACSTLRNPTKHVDKVRTAAYQQQAKSRFASVLFCLMMKPPCFSLWCFCSLPLPRWVPFPSTLLEQLHEAPKKGRGRIEREKGHELGLLRFAAHCATLQNK
jgi:hypothetical protein